MIYRIELGMSFITGKKTNIGPYTGGITTTADDNYRVRNGFSLYPDMFGCKDNQPEPQDDELLWRQIKNINYGDPLYRNTPYLDHHFGFSSLEQLCQWFTPIQRNSLLGCGFVISVYQENETTDMYEGDSQTIFKLNTVELKEIINVYTLEGLWN